MKWIKKVWSKFIIEIISTVMLWVLYVVVRHLLPKKWRLNDSQIKKFMKDFGLLSTNLAASDDSVGEVLVKSKNIFSYFLDERNGIRSNDAELRLFVRDHQGEALEIIEDRQFIQMILPKLLEYAKTEIAVQLPNIGHSIDRAKFIMGEQPINVYYSSQRSEGRHDDYVNHGNIFAITKGYDYHQLTNYLFEKFDNRVYFTLNRYTDAIMVTKLEHTNSQHNYIVPQQMYDDLLNEITSFKNRDIQRSYILLGAPGTGKTTFCLEMSQKVSGRILKLDSKVFTNLSNIQTRTIVENMHCDFIIVDDIDRLSHGDMSEFLYLIEAVKSYKTRPTLLCTVNDIDRLDKALLRPGRFDNIIKFDLPNQKERYELIKRMLELLECNVPAADMLKIAKATDGMSQAYLKEYCEQLKNDVNVDKLVAIIKERTKYIGSAMADESDLDTDFNDDSYMDA